MDWYPFGEEAFRKAQAEDKPIFLSVGYASCHWCHVMHRESFQDEEVARLLNAHFVPVKVDREERPDVDAAYMRALVSLTGQGGWPMSLFLTPEGKPFFGGTYFPKEDRMGLPGFKRVLVAVAEAWAGKREAILEEAERLTRALWKSLTPPPGPLPEGAEEEALDHLERAFDPEWGGFLPAPKFPQGPLLLYLLARAWEGEERAARLLRPTLRAMALGGVYDQVGGGFHRYSVDRFWRLPHFEKMLYDNALLARVYLGAYKLFGEDLFLRVARETLDWLLSMQRREGGFHTALDAESEGEEGRYYTWAEVELREALGEGFFAWREGVRAKLQGARRRRMPPALDDKVLADWSALAVRALAEAGRLFGEERYLEAARRGARFLLAHMYREGLLRHTWRGSLGEEAYLSDQAFAALAFLELYAATGEWPYLDWALRLAEAGWRLFREGPSLPLPAKEVEEGALPSGESALAEALVRLGAVFGGDYRERAEEVLAEKARWLARYPHALPGALLAKALWERGTELALPLPSPLLETARGAFLPLTQLVLGPAGALPALEGREAGTAYVCRRGVCLLPVDRWAEVEARVRGDD